MEMDWNGIWQVTWDVLNSPAVIAIFAVGLLWLLNKLYASNPAVAKPRPLQRQLMHRVDQLTFIVGDLPTITLGRPGLADGPADPTL